MLKFSLSSQVFNDLIKRLLVATGSDKTAKLYFSLQTSAQGDSTLDIFYSSKIEKSESSSLFYERVPVLSGQGNGIVGLLVDCLYSLSIPSYISDEKYPHCKEVCFDFKQSILDISFAIKWNKPSKLNNTLLHFPLLAEDIDLENFSILFKDSTNKLKLNTKDLEEASGIVGFIKSDITSKDSNGVFFKKEDKILSVVSTDSSIAACYRINILEDASKKFECVLSPLILNGIKNFISDSEEITIWLSRSQIFVSTGTRHLCSPTMNTTYIIEEPTEFFKVSSPKVCTLDLKPTINQSSVLSKNNKHVYKKLVLEFINNKLSIQTDLDKTQEVPTRQVFKDTNILVNGDFFVCCCNRMLMLDLNADLFYDEDSSRITLTTQDDKLIILMQGLSL